jgi:DNA-binding Xre family transcriptional regulator
VEEGVRRVTRSRTALLVFVGAALFLVAILAGVGDGDGSQLEQQLEGGQRSAKNLATLTWSDVGLGALSAALLGAVGTHLLARRREVAAEEREKAGLLRLVVIEVELNATGLQEIVEDPDLIQGSVEPLASNSWEAARVRLAQLLPREDYEVVADHYFQQQRAEMAFRRFRNPREWPSEPEKAEFARREVLLRVRMLRRSIEAVRKVMQKHLRDLEQEGYGPTYMTLRIENLEQLEVWEKILHQSPEGYWGGYRVRGDRITQLRRERFLTLEETARRAGISITTLGELERGEREAIAQTVVKIAKALDVEPSEIVREE